MRRSKWGHADIIAKTSCTNRVIRPENRKFSWRRLIRGSKNAVTDNPSFVATASILNELIDGSNRLFSSKHFCHLVRLLGNMLSSELWIFIRRRFVVLGELRNRIICGARPESVKDSLEVTKPSSWRSVQPDRGRSSFVTAGKVDKIAIAPSVSSTPRSSKLRRNLCLGRHSNGAKGNGPYKLSSSKQQLDLPQRTNTVHRIVGGWVSKR